MFTWAQLVGIFTNPLWAMGAKIVGISAFSVWAHRFAIVQGWVQSPKGQALLSDGVQGIQLIEKIAADSGHPAKNQAAQVLANVQAFVKSIPPATKALLIGFALLALAGQAHAVNLTLSQNFGAGASVYSQTGGDFKNTGIEATTYGLNLGVEQDVQTGTTVTASGAVVPVMWADNYFIVSAGASWEPYSTGSTDGHIGAYLELGTSIPLTTANLMVGGIGNFGTGLENPFALVASVNFQIGNVWGKWPFK
jgi:hypothetical protein